ncbi:hypothetical protein EV652_107403 [Kribbella steppae]|uniref:Uncharacterized protein n=1 Tax=Kribbella steppae TaxID=2512223 RepID=A0A4R2HDV1_9ACTN|nr:hypothetical protein [Kribbella steppae]TCO26511.1 hypothetical protein EV652_107403 [Kribbella steppae]
MSQTATVVGRTLGSLRGNRPFRLLWFSNLFFFGGVWTQTLVLGWLVYKTTRTQSRSSYCCRSAAMAR